MSLTPLSPALRQTITTRDHYRCVYCQSQAEIAGMQFTIDHIIPESLGGTHEESNLCLACWDCNLIKQNRIAAVDPQTGESVPLFHPLQDKWETHFSWQDSGTRLAGITPIGRATVAALRLNRPWLVRARHRWVGAGWHPPQQP